MSDIITTLHPENDEGTNLYPNIKKENIPYKSINISRVDDDIKSLLDSINELHPSGVNTSTTILAFTSNKGIWVGSDNGHWYYWNGTQYVDGGIYQAIVNDSITSDMLKDKCINYNKLDDSLRELYESEDITLSLTNATYYDYITEGRDTTATMSSALLNVTAGDEYLLTSVNTINNRVAGIMFFDSNDAMLSYLLPNAYNVTDYYFKVPSGAVKMGLSFKTSENKALKKVHLKSSSSNSFKNVKNIMQNILTKTSKIVIIGDSIGAGVDGTGYELSTDVIIEIGQNTYYRVTDTGYCWVNLLRKYLSTRYPNITILNNSISGMTSSLVSTNTRLNALIPNDTDLVICALGTNDRNNTKSTIMENLQFLENYCKNLEIPCLLMNNKACSVSNEESKSLHMEDISNIINEVSYNNNYEMIDIYTLFNEYCDYKDITIDSLLTDGLHPNDDGYKVMFYLICKLLGIATPRKNATWFDDSEI